MSEQELTRDDIGQELTRDEKITLILDFNQVHDNHRDHLREHLALLADEIIDRQYNHCIDLHLKMINDFFEEPQESSI